MVDAKSPDNLEGIKEKTGISRRGFLKGVGISAAAVATGTLLVHETETWKEGVQTDCGVFHAVYENHISGIKTEDIPRNLNGYFIEGNFNSFNSQQTLRAHLSLGPLGERKFFAEDTLLRFAREKTYIITGDIATSRSSTQPAIQDLAPVLLETVGGIALINKFRQKDSAINRRKFLKRAGLAATAWTLSPLITGIAGVGISAAKEQALTRIAARISGMQSHLHPEDKLIFFRNLVMADKLLLVAEETKSQGVKQPHFGFQVGGGHGGIEDLLLMGRDDLHKLLFAYPDALIRHVIESNGGMDALCTARIINLPSDLSSNDFEQGLLKEERAVQEVEHRIVDTELLQRLSKKVG